MGSPPDRLSLLSPTGRRSETAALKTDMALFFSGAVTSKSPSNHTSASTRPERRRGRELLMIGGEFAVGLRVADGQSAGTGRL